LPLFPPPDQPTVIKSNNIWIDADLRREKCRNAAVRCRYQILDTTPISVICYELAKIRQGLPAGVLDLAARYKSLIGSGRLSEPDKWVFLWASPQTISARLEEKGGTRPFLMSTRTMEYLDRFRRLFREEYCGSAALDIDTEVTPPSDSAARVAAFLTARRRPSRKPLAKFLQDLLSASFLGRLSSL